MTTIYYANSPHPVENKEWGKFYNVIHFSDDPNPIQISEKYFKKFWKKAPTLFKTVDKEWIFSKLNGPDNPLATKDGQARLRAKGIQHTSMSVGDVIKVKDKYYVTANVGFRRLMVK